MREKHVDAIGMILQSIDWSAVKMSATSPAGDRFLVDGVSPARLRVTVVVSVEVDPAPPPGEPSRTSALGLPRFRGQVNAFGHLMTFASTVVGVGAVGHARSAWSKGLVGARRASTGPAASTPGAAA